MDTIVNIGKFKPTELNNKTMAFFLYTGIYIYVDAFVNQGYFYILLIEITFLPILNKVDRFGWLSYSIS